MKVALWGSYSEGNFGDDLMALLLARECAAAGASVITYKTPSSFPTKYGIERATSLDELLASADVCVIGGGEFLFRNAPLKRVMRAYLRDFEYSCLELAVEAERRSIPLAAISIGGDGTMDLRALSPQRRRLFGSPMLGYASVRLSSDLAVLSREDRRVDYFPDVLLATSAMLPPETRSPGPIRVGLNMHRRVGEPLLHELRRNLDDGTGVELVVVRSHLADSGHDYELSANNADGIGAHSYEDALATARFLGDLDVIVSSKLHVGVVAASYGATFVSYCGKPKAREFMRSVGNPYVYGPRDQAAVVNLVRALVTDTRGCGPDRPCAASISRYRDEALGHVRAIRALSSNERA